MIMETIFVYGQPVTKNHFTNRVKEIDRLYRDICIVKNEAFTNLAILGQRRVGKTSLIKNTIDLLDKDEQIIPLFIDCMSIPSMRRLSTYIADGAKNAYYKKTNDTEYISRVEQYVKKNIADFLSKFHEIDVSVASYVSFHLSIQSSSTDEQTMIEQSLNYVEQLAHRKNVYFVIFLDEFSEIAIRWGEEFPKILRTIAQQQTRVLYVLSSSAITYMNDLVYNSKSPFYRQLKPLLIGPLPQKEAALFIRERLKIASRTIGDEALNEMIKLTNGLPDYIQRIGALIIDSSENTEIGIDDVKNAYSSMFVTLDPVFNSLLTKLSENSSAYSDIVISTAKYKKRSKIAADAGIKANSIQYYLPYLMNLGIIEKTSKGNYEHVDPVFKQWILNRFDNS